MSTATSGFRIEKDFLGERQVPIDAYYGVQTLRAIENFPITGYRIHPALIRAMAIVKKAAALANRDTGHLDAKIADAISAAADEVIAGKFHDQFLVDPIQGGAGTSINMNTNEVLANRALEILGAPKGSYKAISPNSHVNMAQSTNDAFPTGVHIATLDLLKEMLGELRNLRDVFREGVFPVGQTDPASESKTAGRVDVPFWIGSEKRYFLSGRLTAGATGPAPTAPPAGK